MHHPSLVKEMSAKNLPGQPPTLSQKRHSNSLCAWHIEHGCPYRLAIQSYHHLLNSTTFHRFTDS